MAEIDQDQLDQWRAAVGRATVEHEPLDRLALRRFARAVGLTHENDDPPLPHWAFFLPCPQDGGIGPDGHPMRGGFLPAITLPRRMFAASEMRFEAPLTLGEDAQLTATIARVEHKSGRSGEMVFVDVERVLEQAGSVRVRERQTFVYRGEGDAPVPLPTPLAPPPHIGPDGEAWQPDEVNLFRFSAATFNAHRIHYDLPYTRDVEGYPALIVHGPFTAARLARLAMREGALAEFSFRAMAPLFLGQAIVLCQSAEGRFEAVRCDGTIAMEAIARYR